MCCFSSTTGPEYGHAWTGKTYYRQLRIDPLPPRAPRSSLQALMGDGAELAPLKRLLIDQTEGNPFFLEEAVRTLVETGALAGDRGAYRLMTDVPAIRVPATVQSLLTGRIDRLRPRTSALLQAAAVVGKDVPVALLQTLDDCGGDLRRDLASSPGR